MCPHCGTTLTAGKLTPEPSGELVCRCIACQAIIQDVGTTLRYYSGIALLDSSAIISGCVSKDLQRKGLFGGFTFLLHPLVERETETPGGQKERAILADFAAMDRIGWRSVEGRPVEVASDAHDDEIIEAARSFSALLVTWDKGMYGKAVARRVFCLTFRT